MGIVIRQSLKGTFVNYIGVVLGIFVQFYVVAKYLGDDPTVIGLQKVIYEVSFLMSTLALLGSGSAGMRFFPYFKDEKTGNHGFLFYYGLYPVIGIALMTMIYLCLSGPIQGYFSQNSPLFNEYYYLVIPMMIVLAIWVWGENYANINMRIAIPKTVREIGMRCLMLIIYLAYGYRYIGVTGLIVSFIAGYGLCMLISTIYSLRIGSRELKHDWSYIKPFQGEVLRYSGFLMIATISGNLMSQLDVFMLSGVKGLYSAGVYTIVVYMAEVVNMPTRNITPISTPLAAKAMKEGNMQEARDLYRQVSIHQMLASTVLLMIVWINLDNIFAIIPNGDKFAEGRWAVLFLGLSKVIYGTLNFGNTLISFSKYYYWTLIVTVVLTLLTIGTNLYFIPLYGLSGAALATLIATVLSYGYQQYLVQVKLKVDPFSIKHVVVSVILVLLFGLNWFIPSMVEVSPWLDGGVRSVALLAAAALMIYFGKVSPQINWMIDKYILRKQ